MYDEESGAENYETLDVSRLRSSITPHPAWVERFKNRIPVDQFIADGIAQKKLDDERKGAEGSMTAKLLAEGTLAYLARARQSHRQAFIRLLLDRSAAPTTSVSARPTSPSRPLAEREPPASGSRRASPSNGDPPSSVPAEAGAPASPVEVAPGPSEPPSEAACRANPAPTPGGRIQGAAEVGPTSARTRPLRRPTAPSASSPCSPVEAATTDRAEAAAPTSRARLEGVPGASAPRSGLRPPAAPESHDTKREARRTPPSTDRTPRRTTPQQPRRPRAKPLGLRRP